MLNTQHPDFHKLLDLIATNEYENIVLAISMAPSIGVDIIQAIQPLLEANYPPNCPDYIVLSFLKGPYKEPLENWDIEKQVCFFLQQKSVTVKAYPDASTYHGLIFCRNINTLAIDAQNKDILTNFEYFHDFKLIRLRLTSCAHWPLSTTALENLAKQGLEILEVTGASYAEKPNNQEFIIHKEVGSIHSLLKLSIDHNLLKRLPEELLALTELEHLYIYTLQKDLKVPDKMFSLPRLSFVSANDIPSNTFLQLSPRVTFNISKPRFLSFFKLLAWKKSYSSHWNPDFKGGITYFFALLLRILHFPIFLFGWDARSKVEFYFRASVFGILLLLLSPLLILYILVKYWGMLPELYLQHTKVYRRSAFVYRIAEKATPRPSSIEGIGDIGCLGGIFLMVIFFFQDAFVPMLCRYLFLPLAIILTPVDWVVGAVGKLMERK